MLTQLQALLDKCLRSEMLDASNASGAEGLSLEPHLLNCIELLLGHLPANDPYAMTAYTWLFETCSTFDVDRHQIAGIHRVLFAQRIRTNTGNFFDSVARQIEQLLLLSVDDPEPTGEQIGSNDFRLKSLNLGTLSTCLTHLCAALRQQIDDVEYFITKAKSLLATLRIVGPTFRESCKFFGWFDIGSGNVETLTSHPVPYLSTDIHDMRTVEQKCSAQLILIAQAARPLCTVGLPAGTCSDLVVRMLLDFYTCCGNFTKHLQVRHAAGIPVQYGAIRFDRLIRVAGRPLATRIYELIEHIENGVFADERYTSNSAADRAKVLRATRQLPKLVQRIEMLNKLVLALGKQTKVDLSAYLHAGMVRDFRIRGSAMRDVLDERQAANEIDDNDAADATDDNTDSEEDADDGITDELDTNAATNVDETEDTVTPSSTLCSATTATGRLRERTVADLTRPDGALQNMAIINARVKRRRTIDDGPDSIPEIAKAIGPVPKKKKVKRIPPVKNKTRAEEKAPTVSAAAAAANTTRRSARNRSNSTMD